MKMTKTKLLVALLALMLVLAACGGGNGNGNGEIEDVGPVYRGVISGDTYTSSFIGLSFTLPENWVFAGDAEIAAMMGIAANVLAAEDIDFDAANIETLYDMLASNPLTGDNIMVMIEDLTLTSPLAPLIPTRVYLDELKAQMEELDFADYVFADDFQVTIGGQTWDVLSANVDMMGMEIEQHYLVRRQGNYMIAIIATFMGDMSFDDMMSYFS